MSVLLLVLLVIYLVFLRVTNPLRSRLVDWFPLVLIFCVRRRGQDCFFVLLLFFICFLGVTNALESSRFLLLLLFFSVRRRDTIAFCKYFGSRMHLVIFSLYLLRVTNTLRSRYISVGSVSLRSSARASLFSASISVTSPFSSRSQRVTRALISQCISAASVLLCS